MSGELPDAECTALSSSGFVAVTEYQGNDTFDTHLAAQVPRLYRIIEGL